MNEWRIVFQKLHISAPFVFFPFYRAQKKKFAVANVFETVPTSASLKNFVSHLITNLQTSAKFLKNWIVKFMEESKIDNALSRFKASWTRLFFIFCQIFGIFNDYSKFLSTFGVLHFEKSSNVRCALFNLP